MVENLPADGRTLRFGRADAWAVTAAADALEAPPESLEGTVEVGPVKAGGRVLVKVTGRAAATRACDRCGEPTPLHLETDSELVYVPAAVSTVDELPATRNVQVQKAAKPDPIGLTESTRLTVEEAEEAMEEQAVDPLSDDDLEVGWYEGGELDLGDVVREALTLDLPPRVVCEDVAACDARTAALLGAQPERENPFAALKGLDLSAGGSAARKKDRNN